MGTAVVLLSLALAASLAAVAHLAHLWREDSRRRDLSGKVAKNYEYWSRAPDVVRELRASCDLAMAEVVKSSIRARTPEAMAYREGAFDALSTLKRHLASADPASLTSAGALAATQLRKQNS